MPLFAVARKHQDSCDKALAALLQPNPLSKHNNKQQQQQRHMNTNIHSSQRHLTPDPQAAHVYMPQHHITVPPAWATQPLRDSQVE
jgi:hypothetical protein